MAPTDFRSENQSQLDKLMELFSKFSNVAGRINGLHNSINQPPGVSIANSGSYVYNELTEWDSHISAVNAAPNTSIDENNMCKDMVVVNMSNTGNGSNVGSTDVNNKCLCLEGVHSDVQSSINNSYSNTNSLDSICYDSASDLDFGFSNTYSEEFPAMNCVIDVQLPDHSSFIEERLEQILNKEDSKTELTNYFYYLYESDGWHTGAESNYVPDSCRANTMDNPELIDHNVFADSYKEIESPELSDVVDSILELCEPKETGTAEWNEQHCSNIEVDESSTETLTADVEIVTQPKSANVSDEPYRMKVKHGQGCDKTKMHVSTSNMGRYTKKNCCCYCLKQCSKLGRHLGMVHKDKEEVKEFLALPIDSDLRKALIGKLRAKGRSSWNADAKINGGELSVCRRPNKKYGRDATQFVECESCGEYLRSTGLRRHWNHCTGNPLPGERVVKEFSRLKEGRLHVEASQDLHSIFSRFGDDAEILVIRFDWIVISYGNNLCINLWRDYQFRVIRTKLRSAGKLLIASKSICPEITDFASLYNVSNCITVVGAIRNIAGFDTKTKMFKSPATASALVTLVNAIGKALSTEYMRRNDDEKHKAVNRFLTVFEEDAKLKINKAVSVTQTIMRREKIEILPSTEDVGKLAAYLDAEREIFYAKLSKKFSVRNWLHLAKLTLMSVLVFNRKRVGDTQNILTTEFERREIIAGHKKAIPDQTKDKIKSRMKVRGKLHRTVPVLLKHHYDDSLALLLRHRKKAGVPDNNIYLFGLPSKSGNITTIDACALFRTYSQACGAEDPSSLRGTKLRKHFASTCATLNLSDNDITNIANFMGHSDKIHRDIYRHNALHQEVVQMSQLLELAQGHSDGDIVDDTDELFMPKEKTQGKRKLEQPQLQKEIGKNADESCTTRTTQGKRKLAPAGTVEKSVKRPKIDNSRKQPPKSSRQKAAAKKQPPKSSRQKAAAKKQPPESSRQKALKKENWQSEWCGESCPDKNMTCYESVDI